MRAIKIIYDLLKLPYEESLFKGTQNPSDRFIKLGTFSPLDLEEDILEALINDYCRYSRRFDGINLSSQIVLEEIQKKQWLMYREYKKVFQAHHNYHKTYKSASLLVSDESRSRKQELLSNYEPFQEINLHPKFKSLLSKHFPQIDTPSFETYLEVTQKADLPISRFLEQRIPLYIDTGSLKHHSAITSGSGGGKSELIKVIVHHLTKKECSIIVIDPSGKMSEELGKALIFSPSSPFAEKLVFIDPFLGENEGRYPVFNPFDIKDKSERNISHLTPEIVKSFENILHNTEFTNQMFVILQATIETLLGMNKTVDITTLQDFMGDSSELIKEGKRSKNAAHKAFFEKWFTDKKYEHTKTSIYTKLQYLAGKPNFLRFVSGKSSFNLEDLMNSKKVIIFNLSSEIGLDVSKAIGSFIVGLIQGIAHKRKDFKSIIPCFLVIDECQNYITEGVEKILTESRKYGLHAILSSQILGQKADSSLKEIILQCTEIKLEGRGAKTPNLSTGEFLLKTKSGKTVKFKVSSDLIDQKNSMSESQWQQVRKTQLERYYRPINKEEEQTETAPEENLKNYQEERVPIETMEEVRLPKIENLEDFI